MKNAIFAVLISTIVMFVFQSAWAETLEEKGLAIAVAADARDAGFGDFIAEMKMVLIDKDGEENERSVRMKVLEVQDDGDKSLITFDSPRDVKGTGFLSYAHKVIDDEYWLYMPAYKRIKRVASQNKSGSFMSSEFSFEDISRQEVERYAYKWIRDEVYEGMKCFVIEYYPVDKRSSGYSRQVVWLDKEEYRLLKVEFFDKRSKTLKTLTCSDYKLYLEKHWRADRFLMINHQNGKSTRLDFSSYEFQTGLKESSFTKNSLKRVR